MVLPNVELARFSPVHRGSASIKNRNVVHIVKERDGETVRLLCGARYSVHREIESDYQSRLCTRCMRVKDKQDRGA